MPTIREVVAEATKKNEDGYCEGSAEYSMAFTGCDILVEESVGDYQGDLFFLVKGPQGYGYAVIGYGSCSGCDALQAAMYDREDPIKETVDLLERILKYQTHWEPTKASMRAYIATQRDQEIDRTYCSNREEYEKVQAKVAKELED